MVYRRLVLIQCFILLLATWVPATESNIEETNYKYKQEIPPVIVSETKINLCDFLEKDSKVRCYCEYGGEEDDSMNSPDKADCWVMNGIVQHDDPIWESFKNFPKLEKLSFKLRPDSTIDFIPKSVFRYLKVIKNINIKYANVKEIEAHTFKNLATLENIDLSRNDIEEMKPFAFSHLRNLSSISCDDNHLTEIKRDVFHDLPAMEKLYITNNNISVIHDGAFKHMPNLLQLEIDRNTIFVLTRATFKGLGKLTLLALSNNKIEMLGDHTFADMPNLEDLSLDNNNIQFISDKAFFGVQQLKRLSMSENKLTSLTDPMVFSDLKSLNFLDLRYTALKTLSYDVMKPILPNMWGPSSMLYFDGNNFDCNCHIDWMVDLYNKSTSHRIHIALQEFTCNIDPVLGQKIQDQILALQAKSEPNAKSETTYEEAEYYEEEYESEEKVGSIPKIEIINKLHIVEIPIEMLPCDDVIAKSEKNRKNEIIAEYSSRIQTSAITMKDIITDESSIVEVNHETTTPTSPATKIDEVSAKPKTFEVVETEETYPIVRVKSFSKSVFNSIQSNEEKNIDVPAIDAEIPEELNEEPFKVTESKDEVSIRTEAPLPSAKDFKKRLETQNVNNEDFTVETPPQIEKASFTPAYKGRMKTERHADSSAVSLKSLYGMLCLLFLSSFICYA